MGIYVENLKIGDNTYTGETSDGKTPHGKGQMVYANGSVYKGHFRNGHIERFLMNYSLIKWVLPDNSTRTINHEFDGHRRSCFQYPHDILVSFKWFRIKKIFSFKFESCRIKIKFKKQRKTIYCIGKYDPLDGLTLPILFIKNGKISKKPHTYYKYKNGKLSKSSKKSNNYSGYGFCLNFNRDCFYEGNFLNGQFHGSGKELTWHRTPDYRDGYFLNGNFVLGTDAGFGDPQCDSINELPSGVQKIDGDIYYYQDGKKPVCTLGIPSKNIDCTFESKRFLSRTFWKTTIVSDGIQKTFRGRNAEFYIKDSKISKRIGKYTGKGFFYNQFYSYEGNFIDGVFGGKGKLVMYSNMALVSSGKKNPCYTEYLHSGDIYEGEFARGVFHGHGRLSYQGGASYEGRFLCGLKEGQGTQTYENGDIYEGEWRGGMRHGYGVLRYANGDIYEGSWVGDAFEGNGHLSSTFDEFSFTYDGEFKGGKWHGKGKYVSTLETYEGDFADGLYHGNGRLCSNDGTVYEGEFALGKKHGHGEVAFENGVRFSGEFLDDKYANGSLLFENGETYEGEFENGVPNGNGVLHYTNGDTYEGTFTYGVPCGSGKITYKNGTIYEGEVKDGIPNGEGTITYGDEDSFEGEFKNGVPNGGGTRLYPNGDKYIGDFSEGAPNGDGYMTYANGDYLSGIWYDGDCPNGSAVISYENGDSYVGNVLNHLPFGNGRMTYANGDTYEGGFVNGVCTGHGVLVSKVMEFTYEGDFNSDGMWHGNGVYRSNNGESYNGEWKNGAWFGKGLYISVEGDSYDGWFIGTKNSENVTNSEGKHGKLVNGEFIPF